MNITNSISTQKLKWRIFNDKLFSIVMMTLAFISAVPLLSILYQLIKKGYKQVRLNFFIEVAPDTMEAVIAKANNEIIPGGIANGIVGTLIIVGMASLIAIPLGLTTGIYLSESSKSKMANIVRFVVDMLLLQVVSLFQS